MIKKEKGKIGINKEMNLSIWERKKKERKMTEKRKRMIKKKER